MEMSADDIALLRPRLNIRQLVLTPSALSTLPGNSDAAPLRAGNIASRDGGADSPGQQLNKAHVYAAVLATFEICDLERHLDRF